jgi:FixJ family two-component response regulator
VNNHLILYVVDDDEDVRKSLLYLLGSRGHQVQVFASAESFLAQADLNRAGCAILDLRMESATGNGMHGLEVFKALRERNSPLAVLFLSGHGSIANAVEATRLGAVDWLEKPCSDTQLLDKVGLALRTAEARAQRLPLLRALEQRWATLTTREKEVAHILRQGSANKEIARELQCEVRTVESHRARIFEKMAVANPTELDRTLRVLEAGWGGD